MPLSDKRTANERSLHRATGRTATPRPAARQMTVDRLWYLASEADQQAQQTYHRLAADAEDVREFSKSRWVSRPRFRTIVDRVTDNGLPYGAHAVVTREDGAVLLVRHEQVDMWVLPGGEVDGEESFRETARREMREEAGIEASVDGLALLGRVEFHFEDHSTWGVLPIYRARAETTDLAVEDPDGEITAARWAHSLPEDTRDREVLQAWCTDTVW